MAQASNIYGGIKVNVVKKGFDWPAQLLQAFKLQQQLVQLEGEWFC